MRFALALRIKINSTFSFTSLVLYVFIISQLSSLLSKSGVVIVLVFRHALVPGVKN